MIYNYFKLSIIKVYNNKIKVMGIKSKFTGFIIGLCMFFNLHKNKK